MRHLRPILHVVAGALLLLGGCDEDDPYSEPDLTGEWNGTWSNSANQSGTLSIVFNGGGEFPIEASMSSTGCAAPFGRDLLLSAIPPLAANGDIDFTADNCGCAPAFNCLTVGGTFTFTGTYGSGHMQGTYKAESSFCDCCVCMDNAGGTWEVSR